MLSRPLAATLLLLFTPMRESGAQGTTPRQNARRAEHVPCRPLIVEAEIRRGESFRREIGGGLELWLESVSNGWIIRVLPTEGRRPEVDFAELATPPFRSVNPLLLTTDFGFRAQDAVGWNPRRFRYLRGRTDYPAAVSAYRAVLGTGSPTQAQQMAVATVAAAALEGTVEILDTALVPGTGDQTPAAAAVATHYASTAHSVQAAEAGVAGRHGRISSLRLRATLQSPENAGCSVNAQATKSGR